MNATPRTEAPPLATRAEFVAGLRDALDEQRGYAAGKLGQTERALLFYPLVLERADDPRALRAFELTLAHKALRHGGIFPATPEFLRRFSGFFADAVARLDSIGVIAEAWPEEDELLRTYGFAGTPIAYVDQEPDRSAPNDEAGCWLPLLSGRRVLLVCPFADLLRERATRETFEAVWRKTGKPWFEPANVEAVEFPYGYARSTQRRYGDALALLAEIRSRIEATRFDVALIAAGALGSPIAAWVKEQGKVAVSLGGHLQVLFGVLGERWRQRPEWQRDYINEAWIDMPERYRPDPQETDENYW